MKSIQEDSFLKISPIKYNKIKLRFLLGINPDIVSISSILKRVIRCNIITPFYNLNLFLSWEDGLALAQLIGYDCFNRV